MNYKIIPMPENYLRQVCEEGVDAQGQAVRSLISKEGGEPCRDVLRRVRPDEELILASFSPFAKVGPYKEYGPVFVLANAIPETPLLDCLPIADSGSDYFQEQFVLRGYDIDENMVEVILVTAYEAETTLEKLLQMPEIAFAQARFPAAGCFACRIERA